MKILVVAAHPDDEVLGCGGTIARYARDGHDVFVAILGEGETSRRSAGEQVDEQKLEALGANAKAAAKALGVSELITTHLPDNRFDSIPLLEVVKVVESLIDRLRPEVIFTHWAGDLNIDHVITHRAVMTATRGMTGGSVRELYAFEVPSSSEWAFGQFEGAFNPNVFLDISATLQHKLDAMNCYKSESRSFPHPRSHEALTALAQYRGSASGLDAAEAFQLIRRIG